VNGQTKGFAGIDLSYFDASSVALLRGKDFGEDDTSWEISA
jgi:hypothetical protein